MTDEDDGSAPATAGKPDADAAGEAFEDEPSGDVGFTDDSDESGVDPTLVAVGGYTLEHDAAATLFDRRPEVAVAVTVVVAAVAYAVISLVLDGAVNLLETAIFAVVFGLVWLALRDYVAE